jgi:hypothetical protein
VAAEWIQVSLRAWAEDRDVAHEFATIAAVDPAEGFQLQPGERAGQTTLIPFVDEAVETYNTSPEPYDAFAEAIDAALVKAAWWLDKRSGLSSRCLAVGIKTDVFVGSWIDQDQFDLDLPAAFLLACGRAGLSISIVTND